MRRGDTIYQRHKKSIFKVGKIWVHIETTATLLNPDEAWRPYKLENYTGTWTGTPVTHYLDMTIAQFKSIQPRLSQADREWAKFVQRAGGKVLVILKAEGSRSGNAAIKKPPHEILLSFSPGDLVSIIVQHIDGYRTTDKVSLTKDPKITIRDLIDKIKSVIESGVEFPSEEND